MKFWAYFFNSRIHGFIYKEDMVVYHQFSVISNFDRKKSFFTVGSSEGIIFI